MERNVASEQTTVEAVPVDGDFVHEKFEGGVQEAQYVAPVLMQVADPNDPSQHIRDDFI